jgi:hypothetical protein
MTKDIITRVHVIAVANFLIHSILRLLAESQPFGMLTDSLGYEHPPKGIAAALRMPC